MWKKFEVSCRQEEIGEMAIQEVSVRGALDSSTFQDLQEQLQKLLDEGKCSIIVEFSELDYISSAGLGVLMGMLQEARECDGDLKLANMSVKVRNLFDMLGFSRLIRIYDSVEEAREAFRQDGVNSEQGGSLPAEERY